MMSWNSSDTFSFDNAAPVEAADGMGNSENGSGMQSSPEGASSFSHVQSVSRSDSAKRSRPAIEDAERESRPVGRVRTGTNRTSRTPSASRPSKTSAYEKLFVRPQSPRGSPREKKGHTNADDELEAKLRGMENDGTVLRAEMRQTEDEHIAERTQYQVMVQRCCLIRHPEYHLKNHLTLVAHRVDGL